MKKLYPWLVCLSCLFVMFVVVGVSSNLLGLYFPYMQSELGFSDTQTSSMITVRSLAAFLSAFFLVKYFKKFDVRMGFTYVLILNGLAFCILAFSKNYILSLVSVTLFGIPISLGSIYGVSMLLSRWFKTGVTTAVAISACGSGVATTVLSPIITSVLESGGLKKGLLFAAGVCFAVALLVFIVIRNYPDQLGMEPLAYGKPENTEKKAVAPTAVKTCPNQIWLQLAVLLGCTVSVATTSHLSLLFKEMGYSAQGAAAAVSAMGIAIMVSKFVYGVMVDRFGGYKVNMICSIMGVAGELLLAFFCDKSFVVAVIGILMTCFGIIIASLGTPVLARDLYPEEKYSEVLKNMQAYPMLGSILFGTVPGMVADATGSYVPSYAAFSVLLFAAGVIYFFCYNKKVK